MESIPLIPKAKVLPNLDATPILRELFQDEFQAVVPDKKLSKNILKSLQYQKAGIDEKKTYRSVEYLENLAKGHYNVVEFTENVLQAYVNHEKKLSDIRTVEKHIFEIQARFFKREATICENESIQDLLCLKRHPLFKSIEESYVKKYKLLQGEAGLPLKYELNSDFRVKNFKKWKKRLESISQDSLITGYFNRTFVFSPNCLKVPVGIPTPKFQKSERKNNCRTKKPKTKTKIVEVLKAEPKVVFFTNYKIGDIYLAEIKVKNVGDRGVEFQLKPPNPDGPFKFICDEKLTKKITPGLCFRITVTFNPRCLENAAEDIIVLTEGGYRLLIPLIAYLEPPVLKTHRELDEFTKVTTERIDSSYIECGTCFTGDSKVIKLRFRCYQGAGEFFIMSIENWNRYYINNMTSDNLLEIPPFRVYPVYFKIEKDEVIDLFVEFIPKNSGTHIENIVIACDNGEVRLLDLLGEAVGWHSYYFTFQDSLLKTLPPEEDDDPRVKYYLDFDNSTPTGKAEKVFCVCNNSCMPFDFQWKIRDANIMGQNKYLKLSKFEVKIEPENGTFEPNSIWEFLVTITFNNAEIGNYRTVLRFYLKLNLFVLNLPYQAIEEDHTIIQPTGFVRNLYSQSMYGEEDKTVMSPEIASLQGTYESLQESIKSYIEYQNKVQALPKYDFCKTTCIPNPGLCAKPLKKSKTFFNIGESLEDESLRCACRMKPADPESNPESCISNSKDEKTNETSSQKNEIIWDFVDVLVDEIELQAEVVPIRVALEPSIIELNASKCEQEPLVYKQVKIINYNRTPIHCTWLTNTECGSSVSNEDSLSFSLLFDKNLDNSTKSFDAEFEEDEDENIIEGLSKIQKSSEQVIFVIKPQKSFTVPALSDCTCDIGLVTCRTGNFKKVLHLSVHEGSYQLRLWILGMVVATNFETSPDFINLGVLKQGTRCNREYEIINQSSDPITWKINEYEFDFKEDKLLKPINGKDKRIITSTENSVTECVRFDARVPGFKCLLLEVEEINPNAKIPTKQYVMMLGHIRQPHLSLFSARFQNAILAPPGMLHVGQKLSTKITLTNSGAVETSITWGYPFGCHSRKLKLEFTPKTCVLAAKQKLTINVDITALEEGIINHCYVPCFFCRNSEPLILSLVAIAENVKVTFEIIDYPMQNHTDPTTLSKSPFYNTVLRVPWPNRLYNANLNLQYIREKDVINMRCYCSEVEEEASRAFDELKEEILTDISITEKSLQSLEYGEDGLTNFKSRTSFRNSHRSELGEDVGYSSYHSYYSYYYFTLNTEKSKKSEGIHMPVIPHDQFLINSLFFDEYQLEFLNVPSQTPVMRQFVIRNETPIPTSFKVRAYIFGISKAPTERRIEVIKNRVMGYTQDEFQNKLNKNQPLGILVEPAEGELNAFDAVLITVQCYSNTWGEYRDLIICQVKGTETYYLKMFIQIVGHPLQFPVFPTQSEKPIIRFQPVTRVEQPVAKRLKVVNKSAIPLSVEWMVFLTEPILQFEQPEDTMISCVDSNHSEEESGSSSKNYIPKNTSKSPSLVATSYDFSDFSQPIASRSEKNSTRKRKFKESVKTNSLTSVSDYGSWVQKNNQLTRIPDSQIFMIEPKRMSFDPFEKKIIKITFNPHFAKSEACIQEFKGVLTACVKLAPEYEKCPGIYYRPCGINFISELMDFNAVVETPLLCFELSKGDLNFIVDANAVIKSSSKTYTVSRKFIMKNRSQNTIEIRIEVVPAVIFKVTRVDTFDKFYPNFDSDNHVLKMEPGHYAEVELQCSVSYKDVIYAFEQLKQRRKKSEPHNKLTETVSQKMLPGLGKDSKSKYAKEPWKLHCNSCFYKNVPDQVLYPKDSFPLNLQRMSSRSNQSICQDFLKQTDYNSEIEGEFSELSDVVSEPKFKENMTVVEEEISFIQPGFMTQRLTLELNLSFPSIKISPVNLEFGNVYLGETALRYCTLINMTGFPMDFSIKAKCGSGDFWVCPMNGQLSTTNYNCDIGETITIYFKPECPGFFKEIFYIYCNLELEFDFYELYVCGFGTWNEKYKIPKFEAPIQLPGAYATLSN